MLEPKPAAFARAFAIHGVVRTAAIEAGYSKHSAASQGCRLLKKAEVADAVQAARAALAAKSDVSRDWIVEKLRLTLEDAHEAKQGQIVVRSAELLARMHGYIDDKPAAPQQLVNLIIQR